MYSVYTRLLTNFTFFLFFELFSILFLLFRVHIYIDWSQEIEREKKKDDDDVMFKKIMKDANQLNITSSPIDLRRQLKELEIKLSSSNKRDDDNEGSSSGVESNVEPAAAASLAAAPLAAAPPAAASPAAASPATRTMTKKRTRRCV